MPESRELKINEPAFLTKLKQFYSDISQQSLSMALNNYDSINGENIINTDGARNIAISTAVTKHLSYFKYLADPKQIREIRKRPEVMAEPMGLLMLIYLNQCHDIYQQVADGKEIEEDHLDRQRDHEDIIMDVCRELYPEITRESVIDNAEANINACLKNIDPDYLGLMHLPREIHAMLERDPKAIFEVLNELLAKTRDARKPDFNILLNYIYTRSPDVQPKPHDNKRISELVKQVYILLILHRHFETESFYRE
ncbi:MAG: hypothetical protein V1898_01120 [Patescibacteria group bacterium]